MHIKVDEDLPPSVAQRLRERGYSCSTVVEQGLGGTKDPELWQAVVRERQFLMTADKGFANLQAYPPGTHFGVLLLRPRDDGIRPILALLQQVLERIDLDQLEGCLAVATPGGVRIRRPQA